MKFGAIDIGSNAVRLLIARVEESEEGRLSIDKLSFYRVPVRLGADVFSDGAISAGKIKHLVKTMKAFWYLMDVHGVEWFHAYATSAMREATNVKAVIKHSLRRSSAHSIVKTISLISLALPNSLTKKDRTYKQTNKQTNENRFEHTKVASNI